MSAEAPAGRLAVSLRELRSLDGDAGAYVLDSWGKSAKGSGLCRRMPAYEYLRVHRPLIRDAAERGSVLLAEVDDLYVGWICGEPERAVVHYVYTKGAYRRLGVAGQLVDAFLRRVVERAPVRLRGERIRHSHLPAEGSPGFRQVADWFYGMGWVYSPHSFFGRTL